MKSVPEILLIRDDGYYQHFYISRLVLSCFEPLEDVSKYCAIHIDNDIYNNKLSNLKWDIKPEHNKDRKYKSVAVRAYNDTRS